MLLFSVSIVFMASDFPSAVDISFLGDMANKNYLYVIESIA